MGSKTSKIVDECGGNACPNCGKCHDWIYDGDIEKDFECWKNNQKDDRIWNSKNWSLRKGATCTWDRKRHHDYGSCSTKTSTSTAKSTLMGGAVGAVANFVYDAVISNVSYYLIGNGCRCAH